MKLWARLIRSSILLAAILMVHISMSKWNHDGRTASLKNHEDVENHHVQALSTGRASSQKSYITYVSSQCTCEKVLMVVNEESSSEKNDAFEWCSEESSTRGPRQKVVTYVLYGNANNASVFQRYYSLLSNISLTVEKEYPGWILRIYHDFHEGEAHRFLCDIHCRFQHVDLCSIPVLANQFHRYKPILNDPYLILGLNKRMFRFLVMLDPNVDVFLSRDIDSLIWPREIDAVNQWLASNYTFHVMRDHKHHYALILAGMWGAKVHQRRDLIGGLMRAMILRAQNQVAFEDQDSLADIVWPTAKFDVMAHDSFHCDADHITKESPIKIYPFPSKRNGGYFVGGVGPALNHEKCPMSCRPTDHKDWEFC